MPSVSFEDVSKEFPGGSLAVDHLTLEVQDGEFMILVGPSGCGKTTALRMVAGLEKPTGGAIRIGERVVNHLSARDRDIAMVFQNYALYPHMTVYKNLAYGLKQRRMPKAEIDQRVRRFGEMLGLDGLMKRRPGQLSGGQRQRVAMGRALVRDPKVFLLDEPLSNLDAKLRGEMRTELKRLHQQVGVTTIYVTHDQVEAMTLGDHIAVMENGRLQQTGAPQEVYDQPANAFVAGFIGSPPMNLLRGVAAGGRVTAGDLVVERAGVSDGEVIVGLRPGSLRRTDNGLPSLEFRVEVVEPLGAEVMLHGSVAAPMAAVAEEAREDANPGFGASRVAPQAVACLGARDRPEPGSTVRLEVDPDDVHVFDGDTGAAIR
jgi:ABC-type sugar transport system ATPase subunit